MSLPAIYKKNSLTKGMIQLALQGSVARVKESFAFSGDENINDPCRTGVSWVGELQAWQKVTAVFM